MLSRWPIRNKLLLGIFLLLVIVATLACSSFYGLYAYRGLVKSLRDRSLELPLATDLSQRIGDLRVTLSHFQRLDELPTEPHVGASWDRQWLRDEFCRNLDEFKKTLAQYRKRLDENRRLDESRIGVGNEERTNLVKMEQVLHHIVELSQKQSWLLGQVEMRTLITQMDTLRDLVAHIPSHLQRRFYVLAQEVRLQYRTAIVLTWITTIAALLLFGLFAQLFYRWIFRPLRILVEGSRRVAAGHFQHRICLENRDEISELAEAMNHMTARFQAIRDDLDCQVQERTRQVVRSEQLASVGFLAAGVAHEINNPLASIALCSESLESRVAEIIDEEDQQYGVIRNYLRMIQDEAFRCKQITEKLLDFSRMNDVERHDTDLSELVGSVIDMVRHLGRYEGKQIVYEADEPIFAEVNVQEMKQVVLNLVTNGLESLDVGGTVTLQLFTQNEQVRLVVEDDGCGMTEDVLAHLFEPFFTRRRSGQGTGLGLSITYRIVADHEGHIEATSNGLNEGSKFVVVLPLADTRDEEKRQHVQAA